MDNSDLVTAFTLSVPYVLPAALLVAGTSAWLYIHRKTDLLWAAGIAIWVAAALVAYAYQYFTTPGFVANALPADLAVFLAAMAGPIGGSVLVADLLARRSRGASVVGAGALVAGVVLAPAFSIAGLFAACTVLGLCP